MALAKGIPAIIQACSVMVDGPIHWVLLSARGSGIPPGRDQEAQMFADDDQSQAGTAGERDQAEGAEEEASGGTKAPVGRPTATQDPAEGPADNPA